ncbi:hemolysin family protein [Leptotrichia sp. HSP-334]|uniref:Hemolysin family protein n=1 Tax=Leptotrichia rugosa TaxID=3239302 RepID=A0AB39VG45_9FUSO
MEEKIISIDIVLLIVMLFFTAFLSTAESALLSLRQIHLIDGDNEKNVKEEKLLKLWLKNPNELLTTLLFVKTILCSFLIFLEINLIRQFFEKKLYFYLAFFVFSIIILIFAEMIPRLIARVKVYEISKAAIIPLNTLRIAIKPIISLFIHISRFVMKIFKIEVKDQMFEITEEEILTFVKAGTQSGAIEEGEEEMISSIIEFADMTVKEILTPRRDIFALDSESKLEDVWEEILEQEFTRMPIYTGTIDNIVGTVHIKDLLRYANDKSSGNLLMKEFMKEAYYVPITKSLVELLEEFKTKQLHMAIVIDEYGGTQGIVTIEDLLEEIVGEIRDEFDKEEESIQKIREKIFDVKGDTLIEEINEKLDLDIPLSEEYDTISGYIQDKLGKVADVFDQIKEDNFVMKVLDTDNKRVERVRIVILEKKEEEE